MPSKAFTSLLAGGLVAATAASLGAQTLGDVAKKEEERRKATPAGKVYTNQDLKPVPQSSFETPADKDAAAGKTADADKAKSTDKSDAADSKKADKADADKAGKAADAAPKDQKYWRDRMDSARLALERDTGYAEAMQTRINALTTDFVNRDDPSQRGVIERDRQKALSELERLKKQVEEDRKKISDLEDEARRAGVPPGWLR